MPSLSRLLSILRCCVSLRKRLPGWKSLALWKARKCERQTKQRRLCIQDSKHFLDRAFLMHCFRNKTFFLEKNGWQRIIRFYLLPKFLVFTHVHYFTICGKAATDVLCNNCFFFKRPEKIALLLSWKKYLLKYELTLTCISIHVCH